jgi:hypothetical protein
VAAQVLVSLVMLLGCAALAVDVGFMYDMRGAMQSSVDASSLSGATALNQGYAAARQRAIDYAAMNEVNHEGLEPRELTITIGNWNGLTDTFVPFAEDPAVVASNAIRVEGFRPDVPLFFATIIGTSSTDVGKMATAVQGGGHCLGIWGIDGVRGAGDVITDSYDLVEDGGYTKATARPNGDVCTCADMTLGGNTAIRGDAIWGDGYDLTLLGTSQEIWGLTGDQTCKLNPPEFDMADARINNDHENIPPTDDGDDAIRGPGRLFLTGNDNLTLPPGKYYFTDVMIESLATLTITGPTEIYIDGEAMFGGGGIVNTTQDPRNLKIYCTGRTISFAGGSAIYGGIIAPETDIVFLGDSTVYGVLIGESLDFRGTTNIHVEESLVFDLFGVEAINPILVE